MKQLSTRSAAPLARAPARVRLGTAVARASWSYLLLLPAVLLVALFVVYPLIASYAYTLYDWNGVGSPSRFVGLANFARVTRDPYFWSAFGHTLTYAAVQVPLQLLLALVLALVLNSSKLRGRYLYRTVFFAPVVTSSAVIGIVVAFLFNALSVPFSRLLQTLGLAAPGEIVNILADPRFALGAIIAFGTWHYLGYNMVYFLATLQSIPQELYEAAKVDGATPAQEFRFITLPMLRAPGIVITVLAFAGALQIFDSVLVMTGGGSTSLLSGTDVVSTYIYRNAFSEGTNVGFASAAAVVMGALVLALGALNYALSRAGSRRSGARRGLRAARPVPAPRVSPVARRPKPARAPSALAVALSGALYRARLPLTHLALIAVGLLYLYPFLWMLGGSLKSPGEFLSSGLTLLPETPQWSNYLDAWTQGRFGTYFINTVVVALGSTLIVTACAAGAGYALARTSFPGKVALGVALLVLFFLPQSYTIIPLFDLVAELRLLNSLWGVILVTAASGMLIGTFLFSGFFTTLPRELEEAARLDGASTPVIFWKVAVPQAKPMAASVALLHFITAWNAFFIPLVFTLGNPDLRTLAVGMRAFVGENATQWSWVCAGATISVIPVVLLFVLLQRYFVDAIAGAVKA